MKYLIYIGIALSVGLSSSSFAMTEKELEDKRDFIRLALKCSNYNYYAKNLEENKRLGNLALSEFFKISSDLISKFVSNEDRKDIPVEFINRMNDDFAIGFLAAYITIDGQAEAEKEIFGRRFDLAKNEVDYQDSQNKEFQIKAKKLVEQNNCRFIK